MLALTGGLLLAACGTRPVNDYGLAPERLAQVQGICTNTMKFPQGDVRFDGCMTVLADTAKSVDKARSGP
jgi:hypothetical protein